MKLTTAIITGATGYIGSQLVKRLLSQQVRVGIIIRPTSDLSLLTDVKDQITIFTDTGDFNNLQDFLAKFKAEVVFHLAAMVLVEHKPENITDLITANITFPTKLLEAMAATGTTCLVDTGTIWQRYQQQGYEYCPVNLYAATKQAYYDIVKYYTDAHDFRVICLELSDTYGPNDPRKKLIPLLLEQINSSTAVDISKGEQEVDLVHIDDVISAYINAGELLLTAPKSCLEIYSVTSGHPMKLAEIVALFSELCGKKLAINLGKRPYRKREVMKLPTRYNTLPGWKAEIDLATGLNSLILATTT